MARPLAEIVEALVARHGAVEGLQFDEELVQHLAERATYAKHRVTLAEIADVHSGRPRFFENAGAGRAPLIMVGRTVAGRWLCVPIEPAGRTGLWRPVTAFQANRHHIQRYSEGEQ